jgi:2-C-methyl-D-erythritol 4-phosphate cytidylyltransferase
MAVHALIVAAGKGSRFQHKTPKQYYHILGQPLLGWTMQPFLQFLQKGAMASIHLALAPDDDCFDAQWPWLRSVACHFCGGSTRAETVKNALDAMLDQGVDRRDWVLVHDAARPCLRPETLERLLQHQRYPGAILALPIRDTVKRVKDDKIVQTVPRQDLWQAQTPQFFPVALLQEAFLQEGGFQFTDEASAIEHMGLHPLVVRGDFLNIKVTYPEDIPIVGTFLQGLYP